MDKKETAFINSEENKKLNKDIIDEFYRKIGRLSEGKLSYIQYGYAWMQYAGNDNFPDKGLFSL